MKREDLSIHSPPRYPQNVAVVRADPLFRHVSVQKEKRCQSWRGVGPESIIPAVTHRTERPDRGKLSLHRDVCLSDGCFWGVSTDRGRGPLGGDPSSDLGSGGGDTSSFGLMGGDGMGGQRGTRYSSECVSMM